VRNVRLSVLVDRFEQVRATGRPAGTAGTAAAENNAERSVAL